ncbi:mycofactocin biosynthesis chaperone MftB [Catellatospora tritici]|uniref:mycofactocin biosynthesis chaperone MftB n=1 Tax=Catellatospora tritici TaxID=2851566 RepID=UPI001C2D81A5|nr:mycofactocin biosynthesis chaperone MftB [Catellatospora tritici]MBV1855129.1 mycofactocin biosynthesis chaperone MftB [Catellatospora tritici]
MFDPSLPYRRAPRVALRPEPFGALAYDFGTRRLSFLKTKLLVDVVQRLERCPDVPSALTEAGVPGQQWRSYLSALAGLADTGLIEPRESSAGVTEEDVL